MKNIIVDKVNLTKKNLRGFRYFNLIDSRIAYPLKNFVIYSRGRTGTTLLTGLLNCHPEIYCALEIFNISNTKSRVRFPISYVKSCSKKATERKKSVYGFKVKIEQLRCEQGYKNYREVLSKLYGKGFKFIHLKRVNHLKQKLSRIIAKESHVYQINTTHESHQKKFYIDCDILMEGIRYGEELDRVEEEDLKNIPNMKVIYENDLQENSKHQNTANRIFRYLGIEDFPVETDLKKIISDNLEEIILNYDEVYYLFKNTGYIE